METRLVGQKFAVNDFVKKKRIGGTTVPLGRKEGFIIRAFTKRNSAGREHYYYEVQWTDLKRSIHAQHVLELLPKPK